MKADACFKLLGKSFSYYVENDKKTGRMVQISIDPNDRMIIGIEDEDGFVEHYEVNKINIINNKGIQKDLVKQIIKVVNKDINSFKFDLNEYRKTDITRFLQKIQNEEEKRKISRGFEKANRIEDCSNIYKLINKQDSPDKDKELICAIIAYKQHDRSEAYKLFSKRWLANKIDSETCRDFILLADEFKNDVLCFYLLEQFFKINGKHIDATHYVNLWWKYLFYAVKYNNFEVLEGIPVTQFNVRVLIDSLIYVFHIYNLEHLSVELINQFAEGNNTILQRNNEDFEDVNKAINELNLFKNYLPTTAEGYYLRFKACMERIIDKYENIGVISTNEDKKGYIYEYVKSRNYGFIIGFDFQQYFYHWDDIPGNLKKRILANIYSDKAVLDEDKIYVNFKSVSINEKVQAMDIL